MQAHKSARKTLERGVLCALLAVGLLATYSTPALAVPTVATYSYGNRAGSTVDFIGITETPTLASAPGGDQKAVFDPGPGPFGNPGPASGDSLIFNPTEFSLTAVNGLLDSLDSQLSFEIHAKPGYSISGFGLQESGDVFFLDATAASWAAVGAIVNIVVTEVDGKATSLFVPQVNATFTPSGGLFAGAPLLISTWEGEAYVDIAAFLGNLGKATKVSVSLDNTLYAGSEGPGAQVTINKKLANGTGITIVTEPGNPIPEPSSLVLAAVGFAGLGLYGRRRLVRS